MFIVFCCWKKEKACGGDTLGVTFSLCIFWAALAISVACAVDMGARDASACIFVFCHLWGNAIEHQLADIGAECVQPEKG